MKTKNENPAIYAEEREGREALEYSIIKSEKSKYDMIDGDVYSIFIAQYENGVCVDYSFLFDVSRCEDRAKELCEMMEENSVMPANAFDVLSDCL